MPAVSGQCMAQAGENVSSPGSPGAGGGRGDQSFTSPYLNQQGEPTALIEVEGRLVRFLGGRRDAQAKVDVDTEAVVGGLSVFAGMELPFE